MKKLTISLLIVLLSFSAFAQGGKQREKLKAFKIAHITDQLNLTTDEAQEFWPIYNAFETEKEALRNDLIKKRLESSSTVLSEEEAKALVNKMQEAEADKVKTHKQYIEKLSKIISYKKIILLIKAENSFKRKMLEEFRNRRKGFNRN